MINNYKLASTRPHYKVGEWTYHPETLVVRYRENTQDEHEIDLEGITPVGLLDRIFQFSRKREATPQAIGDLVKILDGLLGSAPRVPCHCRLEKHSGNTLPVT